MLKGLVERFGRRGATDHLRSGWRRVQEELDLRELFVLTSSHARDVPVDDDAALIDVLSEEQRGLTYDEVKAEVDVCCTSSNAAAVVESLDAETVVFVPDEFLARNVARETGRQVLLAGPDGDEQPEGPASDRKLVAWKGRCEVHERFTAEEIRRYKENDPDIVILAHPECPPDVMLEADFAGSTAAMIGYVKDKKPARVVMVTECSMSDNVAVECPEVQFERPCNICPHMKRISLSNILECLTTLEPRVEIDPTLADRARLAVERMLEVGR